ncbi:GTP diphosphokinase [Chloropicon primus]|uniref:GTP diphosphokinase n=2 Tax=Chloropicon primus TaxID=1764295 RepID=A0A5B8MWW6_9CHLO|nr:GTP diphosphokinase [Chloropicon primus]UPR04278.1 GTP diphosphokinase [Chloropicon primus]|eukprot:QDZ25069.1 GTP diphosphokinase [Chloropicon primus]
MSSGPTGGLSAALSSSPGSFTSVLGPRSSLTESLYTQHKLKKGTGTTQHAVKDGGQVHEARLAVSLPVNIPSSGGRRLSSHGGSSYSTPRSVTSVRERDEQVLSVKSGTGSLSGLVAPVRPVSGSYETEKKVSGFTPPNELTKPLAMEPVSFKRTATTTTTTAAAAASSLSSEQSKPSLLTMALESESEVEDNSQQDPKGAVENPVLCTGFSTRNAEVASVQEKKISNELSSRHEVFGAPLVKLAFELGRCAHTGQLRKNGEAYLSHVVDTAEILAKLGLDEQTVAAGLLHDVLDDTMMTEQQLREYIPSEVVDMVVGVSRLSQMSQINRDLGFGSTTQQAADNNSDRFKNMLLSMADVRVVLIKLADRLHNMRTLNALTPDKQRKIAEETMHVFVPLANRLGVWSIKAELEDLCFRYLNRQEFLQLQDCLKDDFMSAQKRNLQSNLDKLQEAMKGVNLEYKDLHGRPKNVYGIHKKMQKKGIAFEEVYDLCACRCIVSKKSECYKVLDLVHSMWEPVEGKFKDYIKNPKENGYESLHTVVMGEDGVPFEIQIRTADMHFIAEYGLAAHWQYKESNRSVKKNKRAEQQIAWNRWLVTWQMELQDRKYRPSGSPDNPKDVFLNFPEDEPTPPPDMEYDPIYTLIAANGNVNVKEVPANCSLYQLSKDILKAKPGTKFLVNNEYHDSDDYTLKMGDLVEIVDNDYFAEEFDVEESDDEQQPPMVELFDFERQKLDKMYNKNNFNSYHQQSA